MSGSTITRARGFGVLSVAPKSGRVVKPARSRKEDEVDGEQPDDRPWPKPGTGELVDKSV